MYLVCRCVAFRSKEEVKLLEEEGPVTYFGTALDPLPKKNNTCKGP